MSQEQPQICPVVELVNDRPATTSLKIAECFGKQHKNVIRDIEALIASCPEEFGRLNFELSSYTNEQGKSQPMYTVYFDGFMLLVMSYTGKKALAMKLAYMGAFNAMREKLENRAASELPSGADLHLTPDQQCTLRSIVKAKVEKSSLDKGKRMSLYAQIRSRFNNQFRLAKYSQLPQSRLSDAIEYLVAMELTEKKELRPKEAGKDKFEAYMEAVEEFRARTNSEIGDLFGEGLKLVDVYKFGPDGIAGFGPILQNWLCGVASNPSPLIAPWRGMERAIEYSPLSLMKRMEEILPDRRRKTQ